MISRSARSISSCRSAASRSNTARRSGATSRSRSFGRTTTPSSWALGTRGQRARIEGEDLAGVSNAVDYIERASAGGGQIRAAGRAKDRRDRRRQYRHRRRDSDRSAWARRTSPSSTAAGRNRCRRRGHEQEWAQTNGVQDQVTGRSRARCSGAAVRCGKWSSSTRTGEAAGSPGRASSSRLRPTWCSRRSARASCPPLSVTAACGDPGVRRTADRGERGQADLAARTCAPAATVSAAVDLTVSAVQDGKVAARAIHRLLSGS